MPTDNADSPFRTGEPTEKGWYIVRRCGGTDRVMIRCVGQWLLVDRSWARLRQRRLDGPRLVHRKSTEWLGPWET